MCVCGWSGVRQRQGVCVWVFGPKGCAGFRLLLLLVGGGGGRLRGGRGVGIQQSAVFSRRISVWSWLEALQDD